MRRQRIVEAARDIEHTLGRDAAILINPGGLPIYVRPVDYWDLVETFAHLKEEYAHFYWEPLLEYDENPYFKGVQRLPSAAANGGLARAQALNMLGLADNVSDGEIAQRIQMMMSQLAPGEDDIARKLNAVKAALLG